VTKALPSIAILAVGAALAVAGCGGGDDNGSSASSGGAYGSSGATTKPASTASRPGIVSVDNNPELGKIIVNSRGFTLYYFHKDKGGKSSCYGACAGVWPPLLTSGAPKGMNGAQASKLGTTKRTDGTAQVTYAGFPLYTYAPDTKPGDIKGNDIDSFGAEWYALQPNGQEPKD
jgi:predicted lipoprotein with Yx(FWY)xxD motif